MTSKKQKNKIDSLNQYSFDDNILYIQFVLILILQCFKNQKTDEHRSNLLKQIKQKEIEKIQERKMFFQEGIKYQEDLAARKKSLRDTMQKKMEELK